MWSNFNQGVSPCGMEVLMSVTKVWKWLIAAMLCIGLATPALAADTYGRVVAYDKASKKMTFIEDALGWSNPKRPEFTMLPAKVVTLAEDPGDMAPKAGGRLRVDYGEKVIIIYNPKTEKIETFTIEVVSTTADVAPDSPLLLEDGKMKKFPIVDKAKAEITIYSKRQNNLATIRVPAELMDLDNAVWDDGHNVKVTIDGGTGKDFVNISKAK